MDAYNLCTDGSADIFYFANEPWTGDGQMIARLTNLHGGGSQLTEASVMIRERLDPGSWQVSLTLNARTNVIFRRRLDDAACVSRTFGAELIYCRRRILCGCD